MNGDDTLPVSDAHAISIIVQFPIPLRKKIYEETFKEHMGLKGQKLVEDKYLNEDYSKVFEFRRRDRGPVRQTAYGGSF